MSIHLETYKSYNGNIDAWARSNNKKSKNIKSDDEWRFIDGLLQDYNMILNGVVSKEFESKFKKKLDENFDSNETVEFFKSLKNLPDDSFGENFTMKILRFFGIG